MTSKLKCPFCETELEQMHDKKLLGCPKCLHISDGAFWAKAIQAKQDLEIAIKTLKGYEMAGSFDHNGEYKLDLRDMTEAHKALEQIEHKEK